MFMRNMLKKWQASTWLPAQYGKMPYFWMLSLALFGWKYVNLPFYWWELVALLLTLLLFLAVYIRSYWVSGARLIGCIVLIVCLALAWAPFNYGSAGLVIFAATMCARLPDTRHAYRALMLVIVTVGVASFGFNFDSFFWMPAILLAIPGGMAAIFNEVQLRSNQQLQQNQKEIQYLAALAERERIGRDLHDLLGHTLSLITLKAELAGKLFDRDQLACKNEIAEIEQTARQTLAEVRAAVLGYRNTGLGHELRHAQQTLRSAQVEFVSDIRVENLPVAIENVIALALREAVTNIIRHAHASRCELSLSEKAQQICLRIADNGTAAAQAAGSDGQGSGLAGMRERVRALGGSFAVNRQAGFCIQICLPLPTQSM